ncbi:MAG: class I SAM-dependent methyltransferase [Nitrospirota bacterium]
MDPFGKKELLNFYNRHLKDFGDAPQAVRWTPEGQLHTYETLIGIAGDFSGKRVLDFGCGKGDFYGYLTEKGIHVKSCGIDINENLIDLARRKYSGTDFIFLDIEETEVNRAFDIIFICGVFNLRIAGIKESMKNILNKIFIFLFLVINALTAILKIRRI